MDLLSKSRLHGCREELSLICDLVERDRQVAERNKEQVVLNDVKAGMASLRDSGLTNSVPMPMLCYSTLALDEQQLETQVQDELEALGRDDCGGGQIRY
jgi:hypothetical protein